MLWASRYDACHVGDPWCGLVVILDRGRLRNGHVVAAKNVVAQGNSLSSLLMLLGIQSMVVFFPTLLASVMVTRGPPCLWCHTIEVQVTTLVGVGEHNILVDWRGLWFFVCISLWLSHSARLSWSAFLLVVVVMCDILVLQLMGVHHLLLLLRRQFHVRLPSSRLSLSRPTPPLLCLLWWSVMAASITSHIVAVFKVAVSIMIRHCLLVAWLRDLATGIIIVRLCLGRWHRSILAIVNIIVTICGISSELRGARLVVRCRVESLLVL